MAMVTKTTVFYVLLATSLGLWASKVQCRKLHELGLSMYEKHEQWMTRFGRTYPNDTEKSKRFEIFKYNVEYIEAFNKVGNRTYKLGINAFSDLTNDEFKIRNGGYRVASTSKPPKGGESSWFRYETLDEVPSSVDWRKNGAVNPIKNQYQCEACWAFSAVAAVEGITQIKTGELISLSEQELVDCDVNGNSHGCNRGQMEDAFQFIIQNGGITSEDDYPYQGTSSYGTCDTNKAASYAAQITGYEKVPPNSESALLNAVANQPVSVAIDGSGTEFQNYHSGVFTGSCGTDLNHAVTIIGYGTSEEDGMKYWLVKNSWGITWGEDGYMRIQRDVDAAEGLCGIAMDASYPIA
jgi:KDEL-tailed cysteine endopeptidase